MSQSHDFFHKAHTNLVDTQLACMPCIHYRAKWLPRPYIVKQNIFKLEDLKVLRRSPDLLNNVKIGQGQLQLIMEQILLYHIWGLQTFW